MKKKRTILLIMVIACAILGTLLIAKSLLHSKNKQKKEEENKVVENLEIDKEGKSLVVYFSQSGNTETIANFIHESVEGDIIKLETKKEYPMDYDELTEYAQEEQKNNARPELKNEKIDLSKYSTVYLGYPIWWGDMPMAIYTFLDEYDLSGKVIAPFATHGGSGLSGTPEKIKKAEEKAKVVTGFDINGSEVKEAEEKIRTWLKEIGR